MSGYGLCVPMGLEGIVAIRAVGQITVAGAEKANLNTGQRPRPRCDDQAQSTLGENAMKALILYAGFVIASSAASVAIGSLIERQTSAQVGTLVMLALFFTGLVVSWIATVFVMDGSLKNFYAEQDQIEAERIGREYMNRSERRSADS
jgi:hypothetical protein